MQGRDQAEHEANPRRVIDPALGTYLHDAVAGAHRRHEQITGKNRRGQDDQKARPADALQ